MYFNETKERFEKLGDKIMYNQVDDSKMNFEDQRHREVYQKNQCLNGIIDAKEDDIILFDDFDEISKPEKIINIINYMPNDIYHLAQKMYYFFIICKNIDGKLLSSTDEFSDTNELQQNIFTVCHIKNLLFLTNSGNKTVTLFLNSS